MELRTCKVCPKQFTPRYPHQKFCSAACRKAFWSFGGSGLDLATGTVGAIAELAVSADLMKQGFEVFRALSPSCSADIIAMKKGKVKSVEVRSGYKNANGDITFSSNNVRAKHLAIFLHKNGQIIYKPKLPTD